MNHEAYRAAMADAIYLAGCAVNGETPAAERVAAMDLRALYSAADRHMMTSVVAMALQDAGIRDDAFVQAEAKAIRKNAALDAELARLAPKLAEAGIWYMPLKGAVMKDYYPRFGMRQMSDYDILFDAGHADRVRAIMEGLGYRAAEFGQHHHDLYTKPPMFAIEMHRRLFDYSPGMAAQAYYADVRSRLVRDPASPCRWRFTPEDFYVYMLAHEYKHYSGTGSGLRASLDLYVYRKRFAGALDERTIAGELEKLGLTAFERESRALAQALFGGGALTDAAREILENRLVAGTYGSEQSRVAQRVKALGGGPGGRLRYVLERVFIPREMIEAVFPVFWKHKLLLPLLPPYRLVRGAILRWPRVSREMKALLGVRRDDPSDTDR